MTDNTFSGKRTGLGGKSLKLNRSEIANGKMIS